MTKKVKPAHTLARVEDPADTRHSDPMVAESGQSHTMLDGSPPSEENLDALVHLIADAVDHLPDAHPYHDDRFVRWLEEEASVGQTRAERAHTEAIARAFAARHRARMVAAHAKATLPVSPLRARNVIALSDMRSALDAAALQRCAPWAEATEVAAGVGRALWDEPCERWVGVPEGLPAGKYVAVSVRGGSMEPVLLAGDVVLLHVGAPVCQGSLVVARDEDNGYVVKHVARLTPMRIELESFNPEYVPFNIVRDPRLVVGVVVRILRPGEQPVQL